MATEDDIKQLVVRIGARFPNWSPDPSTVAAYIEDLGDLDPDLLLAAARKCWSEAGRKFAPSTGEIRGGVQEILRRTNHVPSAYEAWQEVVTQISENGGDYGRPVWSSPIVRRTVEALGWRNLRMSEEPTHDRARFVMAYEQFAARALDDATMLPAVRGYIEAHSGLLLESPMEQIGALAKLLDAGATVSIKQRSAVES